jgi:hypothetical protein
MIMVAVLFASLPMAAGTLTLSFSGAAWDDGGSLDGFFTVTYDDNGMPTSLVSANVVTGGGSLLPGFTYVYNDPPFATNVVIPPDSSLFFDATQYGGAPANELVLNTSNSILFLDWQGTNPTSLWVGNVDGQYSSESQVTDGFIRIGTRSINSSGGSVGTATDAPEPTTFALTGLVLVGVGFFRRRRASR